MCVCVCVCVCVWKARDRERVRSPAEVQTPKHLTITGPYTTAQQPLFSPGSILPSGSSQCDFIPGRKNSPLSKNVTILELRDV